jgi:hypothetical protein
MSSRWANRVKQALGLRLAAWYLGTFLASTLVISGLTYGLLAQLLETRDHDIIQSTLREYASRYQAGGLPALARAIEIERRSGTREPLFVRLVGPFEDVLLYSLPETFGAFDLSDLPGGPNAIWSQVHARDRNAVLEIATIDVGDGVLQDQRSAQPGALELPARADARRRRRVDHRHRRRRVPDALHAQAAARVARHGAADPADRADRRSRSGLRQRRHRR